MMHSYQYKEPPTTRFVKAVFCALMVFLGGWMLLCGTQKRDTLCAIILIAFFAPVSIYLIARLFSTKPDLSIDDNGITNHASLCHHGLIPWNAIGGVELCKTQVTIRGKVYNKISMNIDPAEWVENASADEERSYFTPLSAQERAVQYRFEFLKKGMNYDAICAAIKAHDKLYK